ncbi:MAG: chemotaxis response regulator protein-glutamate methylesterase [Sphingomonadales bacterium]
MATAARQVSRSGAAAIRVLLVDDSAVIRGMLRRWLEESSAIDVVGAAQNGQVAIHEARQLQPDIIILDIEMPVMDGLTALPKLKEAVDGCHVIMASTLTKRNADISLRAMRLGATDYIPKPESRLEMTSGSDFKSAITEKVIALGTARRKRLGLAVPAVQKKVASEQDTATKVAPRPRPRRAAASLPDIIAIGSSTGGPQALFTVLEKLKPNCTLPVVITQHMPATFTSILAGHLEKISGRPCTEGEEGMPIKAGHIYVAPGGKHMLVSGTPANPSLVLDEGPEENFCRPAVDPLFRSVADVYGARSLGVILTGMGTDGLKGCGVLRDQGARILVQDEATSTVWGMPGAVSKAGLADDVLPIAGMADAIMRCARSTN